MKPDQDEQPTSATKGENKEALSSQELLEIHKRKMEIIDRMVATGKLKKGNHRRLKALIL